ncbi:MAG: GAK system CofD-like protein [Desulfonauticus sp.]|nr:GAK system CofD-like protein [Desulfonauticus sp.]
MSVRSSFTILKKVKLPDKYKLARFQRSPELGPKILFFSGGSALKSVSAELIHYSHNSIHLITPFDSGGSSAVLRKAFNMPAVGDLRNRLMALADKSLYFNPSVFKLFAYRFPKDESQNKLRDEFYEMAFGKHPLVADVPDPMRKIIKHHLRFFWQQMPEDFDFRGANIGNLVLTSGYLEYERHFDPVLFIYSKLVEARGIVRPIVNKNVHLAVKLDNGEVICGQHKITGKEVPPLRSKIKEIFLTQSLDDFEPIRVEIREKIKRLIGEAELICYPIGSFYSSIIANLLPSGVAKAIANNSCPKIFIPNTGKDPEAIGLTLEEQVLKLIYYLRQDAPESSPVQLLNFILVDEDIKLYPGARLSKLELMRFGVEIIRCKLVSKESYPYLDPELLVKALLSIV